MVLGKSTSKNLNSFIHSCTGKVFWRGGVLLVYLALPLGALAAVGGGVQVGGSNAGGSVGINIGFNTGGTGSGGWFLGNLAGFGLPQNSILAIVENLLSWLLAIFGIVGIIGFAISGIMYLIASGDDELAKKAKNAMKYSIIGIVVGLSGLVVITAINAALSGRFF